MTLQTSARTVIDLGARAGVLDAMDRVRAAGPGDELVLSIAAGAPVLRSPVFLEVLRRAAGTRRVALVTNDARARSLAASVHMPAFSSVAALERHEMDATEPLGRARRAAMAAAQPRRMSVPRASAIAVSLFGALLVLLAVIAPTATITVAPVSLALGPLEYDLRAGPSGEVNAQTLGPAQLTAKYTGTATGSRSDDRKSSGIERFTNQTTSAVRIAKGTVVSTSDGIRFQTLEEKTLPASTVQIFPPSVTFGTVDIPIEALEAGPRGNVDARRITNGPAQGQYSVENQIATTGGSSQKFTVVQQTDYDLAASRADGELKKQSDAQLDTWKKQATSGRTVYGSLVKRLTLTSSAEVVGKELPAGQSTFDMTVTGTAIAYSVADTEPRATTVTKLRQAAESGYDIDATSAVVSVVGSPTVQDDGVHWRVSGRASQFRRLDEASIRAALAGRSLAEIDKVVTDRGLRLVRISTWPGWWPRLPVLDSRIVIQSEARAASSP
jgi:baseplate J-like protein